MKSTQKIEKKFFEKLAQSVQNKEEYLLHFRFGDMMDTSTGIGKAGMTHA